MVVISIIGILVSLTIISPNHWYEQSLSKQVTTRIVNAMHYGRTSAIIRHQKVKIRPVKSWAYGLAVIDDNGYILRQWRFNQTKLDISWHGFYNRNEIIFSELADTAMNSGHFLIKTVGNKRVKIIFNRVGQYRVEHV